VDTPPTESTGPVNDTERKKDLDHLKLLAIFYYVFGGLSLLGVCCGGFYLVLGIGMVSGGGEMMQGPDAAMPRDDAEAAAGVFAVVGGVLMLLSLVAGLLQIKCGRNLQVQKGRTFCMVIAALTCLSVPLGTILGVFTLVVLSRDSVKAMFDAKRVA